MDKPDMYTIAMMPAKGKFREVNAPVAFAYRPKKKAGKPGPLRQLVSVGKRLVDVADH